jgi:hypothetical protein
MLYNENWKSWNDVHLIKFIFGKIIIMKESFYEKIACGANYKSKVAFTRSAAVSTEDEIWIFGPSSIVILINKWCKKI